MKEYQRVFPESKDKYLYFTFRNSHKLNEGMTV